MKSYTDLEQGKKLVKILPIESADMFYNEEPDETYPKDIVDMKYPMVIRKEQKHYLEEYGIPCWSLAALLDQLEDVICDEDGNEYQLRIIKEGVQYYLVYDGMDVAAYYDTPLFDDLVDACVEMIIKLHEEKLL